MTDSLCECGCGRAGIERLAGEGDPAMICDLCFEQLVAVFRGMAADGHLVKVTHLE